MQKSEQLEIIYAFAKKRKKGDFVSYEECKNCLQLLDLSPREYEKAIIEIANILDI